MELKKALELKKKIDGIVALGDEGRGVLRLVSTDRTKVYRIYGFTDDGDDEGKNRGPNYGGLYGDEGRICWFDKAVVQQKTVSDVRNDYVVALYQNVIVNVPSPVRICEIDGYRECSYDQLEVRA